MTDGYIVHLDDLSAGAFELSQKTKITHVYPFLSCVAVDDGHFLHTENCHVISSVKVAKVAVVMDKVREIVGYTPEYKPFTVGGATVAIIDTGLSPHVDFLLPNRVVAFVDLVNGRKDMYDDNGHGTSVAGALAGNGLMSNGRFSGIACAANLISIKALNAQGEGSTADILQAMQWVWSNAEKYNIKVVCMSFGAEPTKNDPLAAGAEALHAKGITVVASGGNGGPSFGTVMSPGISPFVITVGGADVTESGITVSEFSSRGPAGEYKKPDIIAPAEDVVCASKTGDYTAMTGTSIATPIVAGACSIILGKHPNYTPDKVKELLMTNAKAVEGGANVRGSGLLNLQFLSGDFT